MHWETKIVYVSVIYEYSSHGSVSVTLLDTLLLWMTCWIKYVWFGAFTVTKYNKIFSVYQPRQMVKWQKIQHFEDHLCPRPQGTEVTGVPIRVIYIPAWAPCSWLCASQWGLVGRVKCSPCFAQFSDRITCSSWDTRPGSTWNHCLCWSFQCSVKFKLLPSRGGLYNLLSCPTRRYC
jgi:hypothetical protein